MRQNAVWEMWEKTDALCSIFAFTYVEVLAMDQQGCTSTFLTAARSIFKPEVSNGSKFGLPAQAHMHTSL